MVSPLPSIIPNLKGLEFSGFAQVRRVNVEQFRELRSSGQEGQESAMPMATTQQSRPSSSVKDGLPLAKKPKLSKGEQKKQMDTPLHIPQGEWRGRRILFC